MADAIVDRSFPWAMLLRFGLAVAVLAILASIIDLERLLSLLSSTSLPLLVLAITAGSVLILIQAYRWCLLLTGVDLDVPYIQLVKLYLKASFVSFFLPSALSADLYKGFVLSREIRAGKSVVSSIVLERILGLVSILTISFLSIGWLPATISNVNTVLTISASTLITFGGLVAFLYADRIIKTILIYIPIRITRLARFAEGLAESFAVYRHHGKLLVTSFFLSIVMQITRCIVVWLVARCLGDDTALIFFLLFVPYLYIINMLPFVSSRIGLEQGAFVVLFSMVGMSSEVALAVSLVSIFVDFVVSLPGGFCLVTGR